MRDSFSTYHPAIIFFCFVGVLAISMFVLHPVFLVISVLSAFAYLTFLKGVKKAAIRFFTYLLMASLIAVGNPLLNHEGATILWYARSQNPITLESVLYGVASGTMFLAVLLWFSCYHEVMTTDKFMYLFGRVIPSASLILSMVLRFIPRYRTKLHQMRLGQKGIGWDLDQGGLYIRIKIGMKILSMMTTWALESAIDTADSMNARGYGLKGRTSFSNFFFDHRDQKMAAVMGIMFTAVVGGVLSGLVSVRYFPTVRLSTLTVGSMLAMLAYLLFCLLPVGAGLCEEIKWKRSKLKI